MSKRIAPFKRELEIVTTPNPIKGSSAAFLWGPRQTGKTTLLHQQFPKAVFYDLLDTSLSVYLKLKPNIIRQEILASKPEVVIIDEIQKVPELLEEVHWLLENTSTKFILCGSSARKLRREARNLLGGRALEFYLFPLISKEIDKLDLNKALNHGFIPVHYLVEKPSQMLKAYVNNYLKEEIIDESLTRNIPAFSRFLNIVGLTHGEQINYTNISRECGVSASTVRNYYQILKDTLLGFELEPWRKQKKRRLVECSKFYLFDIGIANSLHPELEAVSAGSSAFGKAFEHFLINEIRAYLSYKQLDYPLSYWRTSSGLEVDLIIGNMKLAVEFKATKEVFNAEIKGMKALKGEFNVERAIIVSRDTRDRKTKEGIELMCWEKFCDMLWAGKLLS